jgi:hypothetical protein
MGARVVDPQRLAEDFTIGPLSIFGVALLIDAQDLERYVTALLTFWSLKGNFWRRLPGEEDS